MPTQPIHLVFLHGLLGSQQDWKKLQIFLPHFFSSPHQSFQFQYHFLDLPWHGNNQNYPVQDFEDCAQFIAQQVQAFQHQPYFLIGYSLGGRLALHYTFADQAPKGNLQGLILEGANLGLTTEIEKQQRWQQDLKWAQGFEQEKIEDVLKAWYQQPVFASLNSQQREQLISQRSANSGNAISQMLQATSLAKQQDFRPLINASELPIWYFCGERDHKFQQMARENQLNLISIPQAGHNAHKENPSVFAQELTDLLIQYLGN